MKINMEGREGGKISLVGCAKKKKKKMKRRKKCGMGLVDRNFTFLSEILSGGNTYCTEMACQGFCTTDI